MDSNTSETVAVISVGAVAQQQTASSVKTSAGASSSEVGESCRNLVLAVGCDWGIDRQNMWGACKQSC
jgi:hypothetical protein